MTRVTTRRGIAKCWEESLPQFQFICHKFQTILGLNQRFCAEKPETKCLNSMTTLFMQLSVLLQELLCKLLFEILNFHLDRRSSFHFWVCNVFVKALTKVVNINTSYSLHNSTKQFISCFQFGYLAFMWPQRRSSEHVMMMMMIIIIIIIIVIT
jgi:hypothetical protein